MARSKTEIPEKNDLTTKKPGLDLLCSETHVPAGVFCVIPSSPGCAIPTENVSLDGRRGNAVIGGTLRDQSALAVKYASHPLRQLTGADGTYPAGRHIEPQKTRFAGDRLEPSLNNHIVPPFRADQTKLVP